MKEKLLFVTKGGEESEDGFSYVLELAKTMNAGIAVLMLYGPETSNTYEDMLAAVAFAEEGEHKAAEQFLEEQMKESMAEDARKIAKLTEMSSELSIAVTCSRAAGDLAGTIKEFVKSKPSIEMVFLSPSLSEAGRFREAKKLLKKISRPIVTLTRPAEAGT